MNNKRKDLKTLLWTDYDEGNISADTFDYFMMCLHICNDNELYGLFLGYQYIKNMNLKEILKWENI